MKGLTLALALIAAVTAGCSSSPEPARPAADDRVSPLPLVRVAEEAMVSAVEAGGIVRARVEAAVASRVLAPVTEVRVRVGDRVRHGQTLVVLDGREQAARADAAAATLRSADDGVRTAEAAADTALAEQKLAAATLARIRALQSRRSATEQELDQATAAASAADSRLSGAHAAVSSAAAAREAARAGSDAARVASTYAVLTAPFDGSVAARLVEPGTMAVPGTPLLVVEDTSALQLEASIDDARTGLITAGTVVDVQLGRDGGEWLPSRVVEVARLETASHQFLVKASLPRGAATRTGAFGRLRVAGPARQVTTVPASSLVRRGQLAFVFVPDAEGRARLRAVSIGQAHAGRVEVLTGLSRDEYVVAAPPPDLADGRRVAPGRDSSPPSGGAR